MTLAHPDRDSELRSYQLDREILSLLERKPDRGASHREAVDEKEARLGELFASLQVSEAKAMYRRFSMPASDDHVAAQFARLPYEARARLTLFLADARRRQAHELVGYR